MAEEHPESAELAKIQGQIAQTIHDLDNIDEIVDIDLLQNLAYLWMLDRIFIYYIVLIKLI